MKKLFYIISATLLLSSCTVVLSEQPLPVNGKALNSFPKEFQGKYVSIGEKKDTLTITNKRATLGIVNNKPFYDFSLDEKNTVLKPFKEYYILNVKDNEKEKFWGSIPFKLNKDTLNMYLLIFDDETKETKLNNIQQITKVHSIKTEDNKPTYYINPSDEELKKLIDKGLFELFGKFKKIE